MGKYTAYRYLVLKEQDDYSISDKDSYRKHRRDANWLRTVAVLTFIILFLLLGLYTTLLNPLLRGIANKLGFRNEMYAVIIDAGSTGSRVLAYTFYKSPSSNELVIQDELFHEQKPGLSSYVDDPQKGAESILQLVRIAYEVIPSKRRSASPLIVRATAGLRMLDDTAANRLLDAVRQAVLKSGFLVAPDCVEIMEGDDEGINSWFTVNFLQDRLLGETAAALDLGGGSTQVTYEPAPGSKLELVTVPAPNKNFSLYTHSYSNLGLMAVRYGVLMEENNGTSSYMESQCINPLVKDNRWRYKNTDYLVSGSKKDTVYKESKETMVSVSSKNPVVNLSRCKDLVTSVVTRHLKDVPVPHNIVKQHINAFSYFTDRAVDAGLISNPDAGEHLKVSDYVKAAEEECSSVNVDQPWICLDLTYIAVLLQEAYKLPLNKELQLLKKIKGHEVSWALGLAHNTLSMSIK